MNWAEVIPKLRATLERHFATAKEDQIKRHADDIYDSSTTAASMERIERSDIEPKVAAKRLRDASGRIKKAADDVRASGFPGGCELLGFARVISRRNSPGVPALGSEGALQVIAGQLEEMAEQLREASERIDPDKSVLAPAFGHKNPSGNRRGQPQKTQAYFVSREAYRTFEALSGSRPSVTTNPNLKGNPAGGPFLEFVTDVFRDLGLGASPESWARSACKERNTSSH